MLMKTAPTTTRTATATILLQMPTGGDGTPRCERVAMNRRLVEASMILVLLSFVPAATVNTATAASFVSSPSIITTAAFRRRRRSLSSVTATTKATTSTSLSSSTPSSSPTVLLDWAQKIGIQVATGAIELRDDGPQSSAGRGWYRATKGQKSPPPPSGSVLLSVPADVALSVEVPGSGPDDPGVVRNALRVSPARQSQWDALPWYVQLSLYLFKLDVLDSTKPGSSSGDTNKNDRIDLRPWLDALPRPFDATPIHWSVQSRQEHLQYEPLVQAVAKQQVQWKRWHTEACRIIEDPTIAKQLTWDRFLWGCEMARSRAFSGGYTGTPFNPLLYAFTLLLVAGYVGLHLGTLEQAANGAGVVLSAFVLRDFVLPKLGNKDQKRRRYVVCPLIDMANHHSIHRQAAVSFEFFQNAYSLAAVSANPQEDDSSEIRISYGPRSNDQLLQYYGFVEIDNPHDVYLLPPLRNWDLDALEQAAGRTIAPGRLSVLERAGLLGRADADTNVVTDDGTALDDIDVRSGQEGVVVSRAAGIDPATLQALRALLSTNAEWEERAGRSIGALAAAESGGPDLEQCVRKAARSVLQRELEMKPTTLDQDVTLLRQLEDGRGRALDSDPEERLALQFRIEKKKLLREVTNQLL